MAVAQPALLTSDWYFEQSSPLTIKGGQGLAFVGMTQLHAPTLKRIQESKHELHSANAPLCRCGIDKIRCLDLT